MVIYLAVLDLNFFVVTIQG